MASTLKRKTINALSWSFAETTIQQIIQFIIGVILARLLLPSQFGLIGMLTIFIAVAQAFLNSGFSSALIQRKEPTQLDICSIFYFNIAMGLVITAFLYFSAPYIANFYKQPILKSLTRLLSLVIFINSFGLIQSAIITKTINFKILSKVTIVTGIISGAVGIIMAVRGYGVWSLAIQQVARAILGTISLWIFNSWRPNLIFSFKSLRDMFGFGSRMLGSELLNQIFNNIYYAVIGRLFSPAELGYFTRAKTLQELPSGSISNMVGRVTFPVFSSIQDDTQRVKRGMQKSLSILAMINFPLMIGIAAIANSLIMVLFSEKWMPSVPYLQLLCFVGLLFPMHLVNLNVLQALGRSDLFFKLEIIKKTLIVLSIAVTFKFGIVVMITGMFVTSVISYYLNSYYIARFINYSMLEQIVDLASYFLTALSMGIIVYLVQFLSIGNHYLLLTIQISLGVVIYFLLCLLLKLPAFIEVKSVIFEHIPLFFKLRQTQQ